MSLGSGVIPIWTILMPYEKWADGDISDLELWEWLTDPKNNVPKGAIENWRIFFLPRGVFENGND